MLFRSPLPIDVLRYKIRSMNIQVEREMVFIEEFGNDPAGQAKAMLEDGAHAKEIAELFDNKFEALEMEDQLVNDGAWAKFSLEVAENFVDFAYNENKEIIDALSTVQELIDLELFPDDPQEAKSIHGTLVGIAESAWAAADVYNDGRYADWDVSPRQVLINQYWTAYGDYTMELAKQYDMVEEADTPEQVSAVYDKVARWQRENGDRPIRINGVPFASAQDHSWNKMDREHKVAVASSKLPQKLEWLSWADVEHIIEIFPESAPYMPTSEEAKRIFDWKSSQDALLARKYRIGGDFIELNEGSTKERDNHQERINEEFERMLQAAGEGCA